MSTQLEPTTKPRRLRRWAIGAIIAIAGLGIAFEAFHLSADLRVLTVETLGRLGPLGGAGGASFPGRS